jgi:hypothetical protein
MTVVAEPPGYWLCAGIEIWIPVNLPDQPKWFSYSCQVTQTLLSLMQQDLETRVTRPMFPKGQTTHPFDAQPKCSLSATKSGIVGMWLCLSPD